MDTSSYFREKAKQCRRLAAAIPNQQDPTAIDLLALAEEFEAKAAEPSGSASGDDADKAH